MTNPSDDLLATSEGVDEGSAASTDEGADRPTEELTGDTNPISQALGDPPSTGAESEATPAPPVDMESEASRDARGSAGSGQQLEAGEG